ncbi:unnamed protein product [Closterium sp. Naga37s-1]|nr:unnamed protein product [Closterium sp. Naga37s-1]
MFRASYTFDPLIHPPRPPTPSRASSPSRTPLPLVARALPYLVVRPALPSRASALPLPSRAHDLPAAITLPAAHSLLSAAALPSPPFAGIFPSLRGAPNPSFPPLLLPLSHHLLPLRSSHPPLTLLPLSSLLPTLRAPPPFLHLLSLCLSCN